MVVARAHFHNCTYCVVLLAKFPMYNDTRKLTQIGVVPYTSKVGLAIKISSRVESRQVSLACVLSHEPRRVFGLTKDEAKAV